MGASSTDRGDHTLPTVRLARTEIRDLLERLVEQSLVSVHMTADTVRYFLLESLRLFAAERLAERSTEEIDEPALLARRHCYYYRNKVLHAHVEWFGPAEQELLDWASGAWSNIRRAIDTSTAVGKPAVGLQIGVGVLSLRALFLIGSFSEIRSRIERALAATPTSGPGLIELKVLAMAMMASLTLVEGRPEEAEELLERSVAACDADAARTGRWRDNPETYTGLPGVVDYAWGIELLLVPRDARAIAVLSRAREKFRSIGHRGAEASCEMFQAMAAAFLGSAEQAIDIGQRHLEHTTEAGAGMARSWAQMALAIALTKHGDAQEALQLSRDALAYPLSRGDRWGSTWAVHVRMWSLAQLITHQNATGNPSHGTLVKQATEIAYLAGGLATQRAQLGVLIENLGPFADETAAAEKIAREVLGRDTYTDIEKRGKQLSPEHFEVQRAALGTLPIEVAAVDPPKRKGAASNWQTLSKAEREVAILAAAGWPNSAIGVRRETSIRTADAQMSSIFQKLMIASRDEIIDFVPDDQRNRVATESSRIPGQGWGESPRWSP
jgi:DNA-binding CsgD family transcriptional regulator